MYHFEMFQNVCWTHLTYLLSRLNLQLVFSLNAFERTCEVSNKMISTIPEQKLIALQKVLDYMNNRPEQMNLDATFGVVLTEGKEKRNHYNHRLKLLNNDVVKSSHIFCEKSNRLRFLKYEA